MVKTELIYNSLIQGILSSGGKKDDLSKLHLQEFRRKYISPLQNRYRNNDININYGEQGIQSAYLLYYYHAYICQSRHAFNLHNFQSVLNIESNSVVISMFGCGPCPELVAYADFLSTYFPHVNHITANIFDIAVDTWKCSRDITEKYVMKAVWNGTVKINTYNLDLTQEHDFSKYEEICNSQVVTFQNCINEIVTKSGRNSEIFIKNISSIINSLPQQSILLMSDLYLYQSVKNTFHKISNEMESKGLVQIQERNNSIEIQKPPSVNILDSDALGFKKTVNCTSLALIKGERDESMDQSEDEYQLAEELAICESGEERQILDRRKSLIDFNLVRKFIQIQDSWSFTSQQVDAIRKLYSLSYQIERELVDFSPQLKLIHDLANCCNDKQKVFELLSDNDKFMVIDENFYKLSEKISQDMRERGELDWNLSDRLKEVINNFIVDSLVDAVVRNDVERITKIKENTRFLIDYKYFNLFVNQQNRDLLIDNKKMAEYIIETGSFSCQNVAQFNY